METNGQKLVERFRFHLVLRCSFSYFCPQLCGDVCFRREQFSV